jgi:hypothetical protein
MGAGYEARKCPRSPFRRAEPLARPSPLVFEVLTVRRVLLSLVAVLIATASLASAALAGSPHTGCPVGAGHAGGSTIGGWELWTLGDMVATFDDPAAAEAEFARHNRNNDDFVCVMEQVLPNDASGDDTWYIARDNNVPAR